jgi:hypothetical protein
VVTKTEKNKKRRKNAFKVTNTRFVFKKREVDKSEEVGSKSNDDGVDQWFLTPGSRHKIGSPCSFEWIAKCLSKI